MNDERNSAGSTACSDRAREMSSPRSETSMQEAGTPTEMLTLKEAAQVLRCSKAHLCNVLKGKVASLPPLPHVSLGRRTLIRRAVLQHWLERLEEAGNPEVMS
jgi:excisionase family DNA binding protein